MEVNHENYLTVELVSFDITSNNKERFYFLGISTLQVTKILPAELKIKTIKVDAYNSDNDVLEGQLLAKIHSISDFNSFFIQNSDFYIHNLDMELENGIEIGSHDDGEVTIAIIKDTTQIEIIKRLLNNFGLKEYLIEEMKNKPDYYLGINSFGEITAEYPTFDDYAVRKI